MIEGHAVSIRCIHHPSGDTWVAECACGLNEKSKNHPVFAQMKLALIHADFVLWAIELGDDHVAP